MASSPSSAAPRWDARTWALLAVLCGVLFLDGLDVSMVGMALPSIRSELGLTTSQLQWVVSGYVLGYGGLLLLGGRAADLLGRRRVLLIGLSVFVVASAIGGLVNDGTLLVLTRVVKGMSAAFTAPAGLSIITTTFAEGPNRNRALAYYTATGASGFSLGLVLGGLLTELGWRWTFLLPVPFALAILFVARRVIPRDRLIPGTRRRYDIAGAVTITAAMLLLVRTVVEAPEVGWGDPVTVGSFALVLALLAPFVAIERRSAQPLVRLGILRSGPLVRANLGMAAMFGAYFGFQFVGTLYLQTMHGWSPVETALAFLPGGLLVALGVDRGSGRWSTASARRGSSPSAWRRFVAGYALFLRFDGSPSYVGLMLPTMLLIGVGFALSFPSQNIQAVAGVAGSRAGPGLRPGEHVVPGRRRDRPGGGQRGRERRDDARRVPARDRRGRASPCSGCSCRCSASIPRRATGSRARRASPRPRPAPGASCRTRSGRSRRARSPRPRGRRARLGGRTRRAPRRASWRRRSPSQRHVVDAAAVGHVARVLGDPRDRRVGVVGAVGAQRAGVEADADQAAAGRDRVELVVGEVAGGRAQRVDARVRGDQRAVERARDVPEAGGVEVAEVDGDAELGAAAHELHAGV